MNGLSGGEIGERHVAALRAWLNDLEAAGQLLPTRNGRINLSAIAIACGFDRQALYKNPAARALPEEAVGRLGTSEPDAEEAEGKPQTDLRDRRILQLGFRFRNCWTR